jgi:flagellar biosynthesis/type III secretory pathway protein FliH
MHPLLEQIRQNYEAWERRALQKGEALGRKEGREEGREEALRDVLIGQLTQRFGSVPERVLARIHDADADTLAQWTSRVLTAASLDDVLA